MNYRLPSLLASPPWTAAAIFLGCLGLRCLRAFSRLDETSWMYLAYNSPTLEALRAGEWLEASTGFVGLHPPLYALLSSALELSYPAPVSWMALSLAASSAALLMAYRSGDSPREGLWCMAFLGLGPLQLAYGAEWNNYPLLLFSVAWMMRARAGVLRGEQGLLGLTLAAGFGAWSHALGGWIGGLTALSLGRKGLPVLGGLLLMSAPLLPGALDLLTEPGSYRQPPLQWQLSLEDWGARFGWLLLLLLPAWLQGAKQSRGLLLIVLGTAAFILVLQSLRVAAPHQFPYWLGLGAPSAIILSRARGWPLKLAQLGLCLQALSSLGMELGALRHPPPSGWDQALRESQAGDGIVLLDPPWLPDDDKRNRSCCLPRLGLTERLERAEARDYSSPRSGHPRIWRGRVIYIFDQVRDSIFALTAQHPTLYLVVEDPRGRPHLTRELAEQLGSAPQELENQLLWILRADDGLR